MALSRDGFHAGVKRQQKRKIRWKDQTALKNTPGVIPPTRSQDQKKVQKQDQQHIPLVNDAISIIAKRPWRGSGAETESRGYDPGRADEHQNRRAKRQ